jgi:hypothetical protein
MLFRSPEFQVFQQVDMHSAFEDLRFAVVFH